MTRPDHITVVVDAMGGDQAPAAIVAGAVAGARALPGIQVALTGDQIVLAPLLETQGGMPRNLTVHHASQVVGMCDSPGAAIRQKQDSSIVVGMRLVRDGKAQAIISAGNSGAMMAAAMLVLKPQSGVDRPAIATLMPSRTGRFVLLDAGATTDCKPAHLVQFARMGAIYAKIALKRDPRVGLLSIGEEPTKGDELTKETHQLLLTSGLNFIGNVEPKEVTRGEVDVVVCDGFVGNLILKAGEAFGELIMNLITDEVGGNFLTQVLAKFLRPVLRRVKKRFDYAEIGGALLLGVNGIVVIGHGRSNALAIENAIRLAAHAAECGLAESLRLSSAENTLANSVP